MSIRYTAGNSLGVPSGYESSSVSTDIIVPSCGIVDVDRALYELFKNQLKINTYNPKGQGTSNVPVIFASGERWAMVKKQKMFRDKNDTIILPLISIRRTGIEQDISKDITGRGINQQTGMLTVKRKLSSKDRNYQNLINKFGIKNQKNISNSHEDDLVSKDDYDSELEDNINVIDGGLLYQNLDNNIWEIITIPSPQFYTCRYEIIYWTSYSEHMSQMIQQTMSAYLMQGAARFTIETPNGYSFLAKIDDNTYKPEDNSEDYGEEERVIKYAFNMTIQAYLISGNDMPGVPAGIRKFYSAPQISFQISDDIGELESKIDYADDPENEKFILKNNNFIKERKNSSYTSSLFKNPFSGKNEKRYMKIVKQNKKTGETVYKEVDVALDELIEK